MREEEFVIKLITLREHRKWVITGLLTVFAAALVLLLNTQTASAADKVYADQKEVPFSVEPVAQNGTTLVQLRPLFESLGIALDWNGNTQTITGTKGDSKFTLVLGQRTATINGKPFELAVPGKAINGHTMVLLRFVGEASGAVVGWHAETRSISVYSNEYMQILGITREEAQKRANAGASKGAESSDSLLRGFYLHASADLTGYKGCRGMCWDYYYFINDSQFVKKAPQGGWNNVDCSKDACFSYEVKDGQLITDGDKRQDLRITDKAIYIGRDIYYKHEPLNRLKLSGKYDASSYVSGTLGGGFASSSTMIFRPDGTFLDDSWIGVTSDGSDVSGDGSGVSFTVTDESEASGRYTVINYSILLEYKDGTKEVYLFFRPDRNDRMLKIGGRDFLLDDSYDPNAVPAATGHAGSSDKAEPAKPAEPPKPYQDKIVTDNFAVKKNIQEELPDELEEAGDVAITLSGYQWAELELHPEDQSSADDTIIAFTARYTVDNMSSSDVDLSTLTSALWVDAGHLPETRELAPDAEKVLKAGQSVELLAVFVVKAGMVAEWEDPYLVFSELKTTSGEEAFDGEEIDFLIRNPYN